MKKIRKGKMFLTVVLSLITLILLSGCVYPTDDDSTTVEENNIPEQINDEYFSVLESTDIATNKGGLRFGLTLDDFIENYNKILNEEYHLSISDFKYVGKDDLYDVYGTYNTLLNNNTTCIAFEVEPESGCIAIVALKMRRDDYLSLSEDDRALYTVQRQFIARALIEEIKSVDDFQRIYDKQYENTTNYNLPEVWVNGVLSTYEVIEDISQIIYIPMTKEQYQNRINSFDIGNVNIDDLILKF